MISISREYRLEAAHWLPAVPEDHKCRRMHGHNYRIVVTFIGCGPHGGLDDRGFVMDYAEVDAKVEPLLALLDHRVLNDAAISNPTAELIAAWIARGTGADAVRVYETDDKWCDWSR